MLLFYLPCKTGCWRPMTWRSWSIRWPSWPAPGSGSARAGSRWCRSASCWPWWSALWQWSAWKYEFKIMCWWKLYIFVFQYLPKVEHDEHQEVQGLFDECRLVSNTSFGSWIKDFFAESTNIRDFIHLSLVWGQHRSWSCCRRGWNSMSWEQSL